MSHTRKFSAKAQQQLQEYSRQFALATLRKIPELVEDIPELAHKPPNAEPILSTVQEMFQQLPDKGRDTILDLIGSELILEIPEQMYEYPLRRETLRVLLNLAYS